MKKIQLILLFVFTFVIGSFAQGFVKEKQVIKSTVLNKEVHYSIFLPSDYYTSERAYPVTYLLHGYGDADDGWIQFGEVNRLADDAIKAGKIPPMIIVTPDGFTSFYINAADGSFNYEDFFIKELIPHIEKTYKVKAEKRFRGISGLSMGGYGSLLYALKYPNLFAAAAPLSAAIWTPDQIKEMSKSQFDGYFINSIGKNLLGAERLTPTWLANSPLGLIEKKTQEEISSVRYWIDCGDDDFLTIGNAQLHIALTNKNVPHEYRVRDGAHNWTYWRTGIIDALAFFGDSFHQK